MSGTCTHAPGRLEHRAEDSEAGIAYQYSSLLLLLFVDRCVVGQELARPACGAAAECGRQVR
jgi:hypothetical protein